MPEDKLPTRFLPAERASASAFERHRARFSAECAVTQALDGVADFAMVLNRERQVVWANAAFRAFLAQHGIGTLGGQRIGELAGCIHPEEATGGCGTTESCRFCGSAQALAAALEGREAVKECRIIAKKSGEDLDLKIQTRPFKFEGEDYLLMSMADISADKRRLVLERLFFHDVLNTAGGVQGLVSLMESSTPEEAKAYVPVALSASDRLVDQIISQKELAAAERGELQPRFTEVAAQAFLEEVAGLYRAHEVSRGRYIKVTVPQAWLALVTDRNLLARVIGNLIKNALEAESDGATIAVGCRREPGKLVFTVHNPRQMPEEIGRQVFQRSFSTKGDGRGLGTYSIRLLTEKYLRGKVSFTTGPAGTEFSVELPEKP